MHRGGIIVLLVKSVEGRAQLVEENEQSKSNDWLLNNIDLEAYYVEFSNKGQ